MSMRAERMSPWQSRDRFPSREESEGWAMADLALRWLPYGGPPSDDTLVEFGVTPTVFAQRGRRVLHSRAARMVLSPPQLNGLHEMADAFER
ncbi:hypothetical protein ACH47B_01535 [Rhodococcus sp. NPDC019627]|uniref:hypothetical protein n=1 Tax=unclassified Rhodococcus (in: high G+C Gram-positive bacteria) TaxID=192944 RepID=UPI0033E176EC